MSDKPDYKNTLNLPRTEFPMQANLVQREPQRLAQWEADGIYAQIRAARQGAPKFVLHDGPPFANGDVHVGTALNKVLKDIIVKYQTLRGKDAPYVPGWDCHGLPIESKVAQEFRAAGKTDADAATIRTACDVYARKYIDLQRGQFKRLGIFGEWENPYLTLDKQYEADELRMFADIVEKGFVYRGKKPVYWSIPFKTALAEAEVEYADHVSQSVYVKFKLKGEPNTFVLIWTTTPWTLPANLAVAFNPGFHYSLVMAEGGTYIVANALLSTVSEKLGWGSYQIVRTLHAEELATVEYEHPFCARTGKLHPADFVTADTGTGFVHIAPGHGMDDYQLGLKIGLPIYCPVDDEGRLAPTNDLPREQQLPESLVGKSVLAKNHRSDANDAVLALLTEGQALALREDYTHSYPHCWRSKTAVIFRAVDQWFIKVDHVVGGQSFRQSALAAIASVKWIPDWGQNRIEGAVKTRPDWCISRQRSWGVPIPAFYDGSGEPILNAVIVRNAAALIEEHGSNVWFVTPVAELWTKCRPADWSGLEAVRKSTDTLDVWIDSGSSSRAVLMRRPELQALGGPSLGGQASSLPGPAGFQPAESQNPTGKMPVGLGRLEACPSNDGPTWVADVYLEGSDQHRGWFQSSLLLSLAGNGAPPFKTVLTHGFMVDEDREKISKSKQGAGGYQKPQTADRYIKEYGADVLRLWVASQDYRSDIVVSEERLKKVGETYRLIRNTLRYQLSNLYDFDPAKHAVPDEKLTGLDRWILGEFAKLEAEVAMAYDNYEFHVVYQKLAQFVAVQLSSLYHDVVKDRLYTDAANSPRRRSTQTALHRMVARLSQMLAPMLVFTAEEAWGFIPGAPTKSVHASIWINRADGSDFADSEWTTLFRWRELVLAELEKARQAKLIGKGLDAAVKLSVPGLEYGVLTAQAADFRELCNVSEVVIEAAEASMVTVLGASTLGRIKCERCWHWETDIGQNTAQPMICGRCVEAVTQATA